MKYTRQRISARTSLFLLDHTVAVAPLLRGKSPLVALLFCFRVGRLKEDIAAKMKGYSVSWMVDVNVEGCVMTHDA